MHTLRKYFRIWVTLTQNSFAASFASRFGTVLLLTGKACRFGFQFLFLASLVGKTGTLAGYSATQVVLFFLTFTVIDSATQLLFREVYRFRSLVVSGDFDLVLVKPFNPLFRALAGGADPLDLVMLVPYLILLPLVMMSAGTGSAGSVLFFILLFGNGLLIATAFHIFVLSLTVLTSEIDHTIMMYRDISGMGRVPVDIYRQPLRYILTFIIPVGVMMTFPAKAFLGRLTAPEVLGSMAVGAVFFACSLLAWRQAVRAYASASS